MPLHTNTPMAVQAVMEADFPATPGDGEGTAEGQGLLSWNSQCKV